MARIRTIKPEFWTSAQVMECSTNARLLFIGLWNFADDLGRHPDNAKQVKAEVFPADSLSIENVLGMLDELERNGLIRRYVVGGARYFAITGWHHQRIDKPQPGKYPGPEQADSENVPRTLPPEGIRYDRKEGEDRKEDRLAAQEPPTGDGSKPEPDVPPAWWSDFRAAYPKRAGDPKWRDGLKAARARLREGHKPEEFVAGARRYAAYVVALGKQGTEFVQQASTFLGPGTPFLLPWELPAAPTRPPAPADRRNRGIPMHGEVAD